MSALGTVLAIFRAGTGLDGEQGAHLHFVRIEMGAVHGLGLEQQIVEWQGKQGLNLGEGPVVTKGVSARGEHSYMASNCYKWDPAPPACMGKHRSRHPAGTRVRLHAAKWLKLLASVESA
jgi:hypothetical protein